MPPPIQFENYQLAKLIELSEKQLHQLRLNNEFNEKILRTLRIIAMEVAPPKLSEIKVYFEKGPSMPATPGPITLTAAGQTATAVVLAFDQFGQPFLGTVPPATLSSDDTAGAIVTFDPSTGICTAVANGTANITGALTTAEGLALSDTEQCIVSIQAAPQVLTSIKVGFIPAASAK